MLSIVVCRRAYHRNISGKQRVLLDSGGPPSPPGWSPQVGGPGLGHVYPQSPVNTSKHPLGCFIDISIITGTDRTATSPSSRVLSRHKFPVFVNQRVFHPFADLHNPA